MKSLLVAAFALAVVSGCQRATPPAGGPPPAPVGPIAERLKEEGDRLARQGQWEAAVEKYQAAVNREAGNLPLRVALGTALSHLDRRAETVEHFKWVVAHGVPGSPDVEMARSWLVNAGELKAAYGSSASRSDASTVAAEAEAQKGTVRGRTEWPGVGPGGRRVVVRLYLEGSEDANRDVKLTRLARLGERYAFLKTVPGKYRVWATPEGVDSQLLWDQTVAVEASKETTLDLTPANSRVSPKDFPPPEQ